MTEPRKTVGNGPLLVLAAILALIIFPAPFFLLAAIATLFRIAW